MAGTRTSQRDKLSELSQLIDLCRAKGVVIFEGTPGGACKLTLGPPPELAAKKAAEDPLAHRRAHYENLLCRRISDAELGTLP